METIIVSDTASLAQAAADLVEAEISPLHSTMLGLAGGSTPAATYDVLAGRTIDCSTTHVTHNNNSTCNKEDGVGALGSRFGKVSELFNHHIRDG